MFTLTGVLANILYTLCFWFPNSHCFGNNNLESCDAVVSHKKHVVHFRHSEMQFKIKCPSEPPLRTNSIAETNVVSFYVHSEKAQKLQHGINFVTLCEVLLRVLKQRVGVENNTTLLPRFELKFIAE